MASSNEDPGWSSVIREFLVDGLGMILPGLGFLFACLPAIVLPAAIFHFGLDAWLSGGTSVNSPFTTVSKVLGALGNFHLEVLLISVGLSYVAGHILFRQDIKTPDRLSFVKTQTMHLPWTVRYTRFALRALFLDFKFQLDWRPKESSIDSKKLSHGPEPQPEDWLSWLIRSWKRIAAAGLKVPYKLPIEPVALAGSASSSWRMQGGGRFDGMVRPIPQEDTELEKVRVEYPYHFLKEALTDRGFENLAEYITWSGDDGKEIPQRTKHRINVLKSCLEHCNIAAFHRLARNEAHIRLASSVWYAAHHVRRLAFCGAMLLLLASLFFPTRSFAFLTLPVFSMGAALYVQFMIEDALHYQRGREIIYVLHMVSLAKIKHPEVFETVLGIRPAGPPRKSSSGRREPEIPKFGRQDAEP